MLLSYNIQILNNIIMTTLTYCGRIIHHATDMKEFCSICGKPFKFYWFDANEKNGQSETKWKDKYHKDCLEKQTGTKCKSLYEINEERKKSNK